MSLKKNEFWAIADIKRDVIYPEICKSKEILDMKICSESLYRSKCKTIKVSVNKVI